MVEPRGSDERKAHFVINTDGFGPRIGALYNADDPDKRILTALFERCQVFFQLAEIDLQLRITISCAHNRIPLRLLGLLRQTDVVHVGDGQAQVSHYDVDDGHADLAQLQGRGGIRRGKGEAVVGHVLDDMLEG